MISTLALALALPRDDKDAFDRMVLDTSLKTFTQLIVRANMIEAIKAEGPITVFAPNNAAFAKLSPQVLEALRTDRAFLRKTIQLHIASGKVLTKDFKDGLFKTLAGNVSVKISLVNVAQPNPPPNPPLTAPTPIIGGAKILTPDVETSNGTLHVLGSVMVPAPPAIAPAKPPEKPTPSAKSTVTSPQTIVKKDGEASKSKRSTPPTKTGPAKTPEKQSPPKPPVKGDGKTKGNGDGKGKTGGQ